MQNRFNLQMSQGHCTTQKPKVRFLMLLLPVLWMFFTVSLNATCTDYTLTFAEHVWQDGSGDTGYNGSIRRSRY